MTLQEAIQHSLERAALDCSECAKQHEQLANWLIELRDIRRFVEPLRNYNTKNLYIEELKKIVKSCD